MAWMSMNWTMAAAAVGGLVLALVSVALIAVTIRLLRYRLGTPQPAWAPDHFSIHRYQPMLRLISGEDLEFLAAQPGYRAEVGARLRRERRRILRMYLHDLARDFARLHAAARKLVSDSPERHSALVGVLIRYQFVFWRRMAAIEVRLLAPGVRAPRLDLAPLLKPMESMQIYVSEA